MSVFDDVKLGDLPAPDLVEALDYETILEGIQADFAARWPDYDALVESDPVQMLLQTLAYQSLLLRQRVNDAARATLLAKATGADLDHLVALFDIGRHVITPGDPAAVPPVAPVLEGDDALRRRAQLALEAATAAGTIGRYLFYALGAAGDVADASVTSPNPGEVLITVASATAADWIADAALIAEVLAVVGSQEVRSLGDDVSVASATVVDYAINATLTMRPGAAAEQAEITARANVDKLITERRLGIDITISALTAAMHVEGVYAVVIASPAADVIIAPTEAARCTGVTITIGGVDE